MVHILDTYPVKHHTLSYCLAFLALSPGFCFCGISQGGLFKTRMRRGQEKVPKWPEVSEEHENQPNKGVLV